MWKQLFIAGVVMLVWPSRAQAVPAFARQTGLSCRYCHRAFPELNEVGQQFAADGYLLGDTLPGKYLTTGDTELTLSEQFPFALRLQADVQSFPQRRKQPDFAFPAVAKIISGAPISKHVNYYAYFLLAEYGEVAGLEDAWVSIHDAPIPNAGILAGQFQVMDVIFPRELRLTRQDYLIYAVSQSATGFNLTYQRGVNASYDIAGLGVVAGVVNGNGLAPSHSGPTYVGRRMAVFDNDLSKVGYARLGYDTSMVDFGWFGLRGAEGRKANANRMWRTGPDVEVTLGPVRAFAQALTGIDDNPDLGPRSAAPDPWRISGGFVGANVLAGRRWVFAGLYNRVMSERRTVDANIVTANVSYYLRRNLKLGLEGSYDLQNERPAHPHPEHAVIGLVDFAY